MKAFQMIWTAMKALGPERLAAWAYSGQLDMVDGRVIDPKAKAVSDLVTLVRGDDDNPTVEENRRQLDTLAAKFDQPCPSDVVVRDITLPGLTGERRARIFAPAWADPIAPQCTLLYLHGGGWVQGSLDSHHSLCGKLAAQAGVRVVSYDYVLAPEHKFPAAPDDVLTVYRALLAGAGDLGVEAAQLMVGGDSAGANLTAVLMHDLATAGEPLPRAQVLLYPALDGQMNSASMQALAVQPLLPRSRIEWFHRHYLPEGQDVTDPRFSPVFSDKLPGQPQALVIVGGHDPLWDEGLSYAKALESAGVPVKVIRFEGQVHAFMSLTKVIPQGRDAIAKTADWLRKVMAG